MGIVSDSGNEPIIRSSTSFPTISYINTHISTHAFTFTSHATPRPHWLLLFKCPHVFNDLGRGEKRPNCTSSSTELRASSIDLEKQWLRLRNGQLSKDDGGTCAQSGTHQKFTSEAA